MKERFGAKDERSWKLRFHTQTAGVSLTAQQPYNNVVRTALQALAAVLGGTQSLHTNSLDEALALPTAEAATLALRTQQVIAHESGVTNVVDPLGGSYFVEALTADMERGAREYFDTIDRMGGMVAAIERGYPQREIAESAVPLPAGGRAQGEDHRRRERLRRRGASRRVPTLYIDETAVGAPDRARCASCGRTATTARVRRALDALKRVAEGHGQHDGAAHRGRARLRHRGRDVRCPPRRLGRVRGDADDLGLGLGLGPARLTPRGLKSERHDFDRLAPSA